MDEIPVFSLLAILFARAARALLETLVVSEILSTTRRAVVARRICAAALALGILVSLSGRASAGPFGLPDNATLQQYSSQPQVRELDYLSRWLTHLQRELFLRYGIDKVYIGGGSVRAILDAYYFGKPLDMRDFDVFAVANKEVTSDFAREIGVNPAFEPLGKYSATDLRPRPRGNPALNPPASSQYNAGWGFFWSRESRILDFSIYHSHFALSLNGIFSFDTIMLPLSHETSLVQFVEKNLRMEKGNYEALVNRHLIIDKHGGYKDWLAREGKVVHWAEVARDPLLQSIRVLRSYLKIGVKELPPEVETKLAELLKETTQISRLQITRNMIKLLADKDAALEVKMLEKIGVLKQWQVGLHQLVENRSLSELQTLFGKVKTGEERFGVLVQLTNGETRAALRHDWTIASPNAQLPVLLTGCEAALARRIETGGMKKQVFMERAN